MHAVCRLTKTGDSREKKRRCAILLPKNAREMIASEIAPQCAGPELLGILSLSNSLSSNLRGSRQPYFLAASWLHFKSLLRRKKLFKA
jgi:hypothetical protein